MPNGPEERHKTYDLISVGFSGINMKYTMAWPVLCVVVLMMTWVPTHGQQTFFRSCYCDYIIDGQCAITPPIDTDTGCPISDTSNYAELASSLAMLSQNLTVLTTNSSAQSQLLAQLQATTVELQMALEQPCVECQTIQTQVDSQEEAVVGLQQQSQALQTEVDSQEESLTSLQAQTLALETQVDSQGEGITGLQETLTGVSTSLFSVSEQLTANSEAMSQASTLSAQVEALQEQYTTVANTVSMLGDTLMSAASNYWLCHQKGLVVSGDVVSIADTSITASQSGNNTSPSDARINGTMGWCAAEPNTNEWLQFDLQSERSIYGMVTKGRYDYIQWVTSYKMAYTSEEPTEAATWTFYTDVLGEEEIFTGNVDQNTVQMNMLWQPVSARAVRIYPLTAGNDSNQCMRADIIGCVDAM